MRGVYSLCIYIDFIIVVTFYAFSRHFYPNWPKLSSGPYIYIWIKKKLSNQVYNILSVHTLPDIYIYIYIFFFF